MCLGPQAAAVLDKASSLHCPEIGWGKCIRGSPACLLTALRSRLDSRQFVSRDIKKAIQEKSGYPEDGWQASSSLWYTKSGLVHPKPGNAGHLGSRGRDLAPRHTFYLKGAQQQSASGEQGICFGCKSCPPRFSWELRPSWACRVWSVGEKWPGSL